MSAKLLHVGQKVKVVSLYKLPNDILGQAIQSKISDGMEGMIVCFHYNMAQVDFGDGVQADLPTDNIVSASK